MFDRLMIYDADGNLIAVCRDFNIIMPPPDRELIDITSLDNRGGFREVIPGRMNVKPPIIEARIVQIPGTNLDFDPSRMENVKCELCNSINGTILHSNARIDEWKINDSISSGRTHEIRLTLVGSVAVENAPPPRRPQLIDPMPRGILPHLMQDDVYVQWMEKQLGTLKDDEYSTLPPIPGTAKRSASADSDDPDDAPTGFKII